MTIKQPFYPSYGSNQVLTPNSGSQTANLRSGKQVRLVNKGANVCYVRIGDGNQGSATTADFPVEAGQASTISKDQDHTSMSYISASGTTLECMVGEGF